MTPGGVIDNLWKTCFRQRRGGLAPTATLYQGNEYRAPASMIEENIRRKFEELIVRSSNFVPHVSPNGFATESRYIPQFEGWLAEALNLVEIAVPEPDNAYRRSVEKLSDGSSGPIGRRIQSIAQILPALLADVDAGLLGSLGNRIRAETFDDFLDHADEYRKEGRKNEAGVIAGVVFEDTVRRICRDKCNIVDKDRSLEDLINDLTRRRLITGQQSKQAKVGSHVRTKATHALWDEFDIDGVIATIGITRTFLKEHLGG